jgi:mannan endo-1,4-beta-mannosidase
MKRKFFQSSILLLAGSVLFPLLCFGNPAGTAASNPNILPKGQQVLDYFRRFSREGRHRVISGQFAGGPMWSKAYELFVTALHDTAGQWPALLGVTDSVKTKQNTVALTSPPAPTAEQSSTLTQELIEHSNAGGLVTFTWFIDNPWYRLGTGESCKNVPQPCVPGNLTDLTRQDNPAGLYFKAEMDNTSAILENLQNAGVIVIFRPFHEQNGSWFWWGAKTASSPTKEEFIALWRYTYDYFTRTKKLNNLLWLFAPVNSENKIERFPKWNGIQQPPAYYYPGKRYVDIVGISYYDNKISIPAYTQLSGFGKPFGLAEFGPPKPAGGKNYNFNGKIHKLVKEYPRIAYFMAWQDAPPDNYFAIISNQDPRGFMNDPLIITRDKVNLKRVSPRK